MTDLTDLADLSAELAELRPDQRELLSRRLGAALPAPHRLPLSFTQAQLWFLDQLAPDRAAYNIPFALRLTGPLDVTALRAALTALVGRQESLRLVFGEDADGPFQTVRDHVAVELPVVDLTGLSTRERAEAEDREAADLGATPLDLRTGPLLVTRLLVLDTEEHLLLGTAHHIVFDAWSGGVFTTDLVALYGQHAAGAPARLPEPRDSFTAFAARQARPGVRAELRSHLDHWRDVLAGAPATSTLRPDRPRPVVQGHRGGRTVRPLPAALCSAVLAFARESGVTVNAVALAGLTSALWQATGQDDLVIGMPSAGRTEVALEPLIGSFANMLVLRLDLSGEPTGRDLARRAHRTVGDAFRHQAAPYARVVEELAPVRDPGVNPLFQVMFTVADAGGEPGSAAGVRFAPALVDNQLTDFDLFVTLVRDGDRFELVLDHDADLYLDGTAAGLADRVLAALTELTAAPDVALVTLPSVRRDRVAVAATFTAAPLLDPLRFVLDLRRHATDVVAAPYGQLVQHLLTSDEATIALLRWEDWLRHLGDEAGDQEVAAVLDAAFTDLAQAVTAFRARGTAPLALVRCPASPEAAARGWEGLFARLDDRLAVLRARVTGVTVDWAEDHPAPAGFDQATDALAHIPYTPEYFAALAVIVAGRLPLPEPDPERAAFLAEQVADPAVVAARSRPRLSGTGQTGEAVAPATETQRRLAAVWCEVLGVADVAANSDFFALGGHSLLATQLLSRVRGEFGTEVTLHDLFTHPTVAGLAAVLDGAADAPPASTPALSRVDAEPVASAVQRRLWAAGRLGEDGTGGNTTFAARLRGPLDVAAFEAAVVEVARRHEVLRTTFAERDGVPVPVVRDALPVWCGVRALGADVDREVAAHVSAHAEYRYPLDEGPLLRVELLRATDTDHYLLVGMHHIVCDAASWGILLTELSTLYDAFAAGAPSPLAEPVLRYRDFAHHQQRRLSGPELDTTLDFWRTALRDAPAPVGLPAGSAPAAGGVGGRVTRRLPAATGLAVRELARGEGVTPHAVLLAVFATLLHAETGESDLVVGMPVLGRDAPESRDVLGCFADLVPLRLDVAGRPSFRGLARRVHQVVTQAQARQLPFPLPMRVSPATARNPLRCVLNYADLPDEDPDFAGLDVTALPIGSAVADFDALLTLNWQGDELEVDLSHPLDQYGPDEAGRLVAAYCDLVDRLTAAPDSAVGAAATAAGPGRPVVLASSFGSPFGPDDLAPTLRFWSDLLGTPGLSVRRSTPGQVLRPLLDQDGPFGDDPAALHVLLLRWEDLLAGTTDLVAGVAVLERALADLLDAVAGYRERTAAGLVVGLCPPSPALAGQSWAGVLAGLTARLGEVAEVVDLAGWTRRYGVDEHDPAQVATAVATWVARTAYRDTHGPVPALALDPAGSGAGETARLVRAQAAAGRAVVFSSTPTDPELAALVAVGAARVGAVPEGAVELPRDTPLGYAQRLWTLDAPPTGTPGQPNPLALDVAGELTTAARIADAVATGFSPGRGDDEPRTERERTLAAILREVLRVPVVGIHDDFYELGGDSLQAIAVAFHAVDAGLRLSARELTERRTIAALDLDARAQDVPVAPVCHEEPGGEVPLTPAQRWWFECVAPSMTDPAWFNHPYYLEVRRPLPVSTLAEAVTALAGRHAALGLRFRRDAEGTVTQFRAEGADAVPFTSHDLSGLRGAELDAEAARLAASAQGSLDLAEGPTCRVEHFATGADRPDRLLVVAHHLVTDAISRDVLLGDLQALCAGGERPDLAALPVSYGAWATRLSTWDASAELPYWLAQTCAEDASVPRDRPDAVARLAADAAVSGTLTVEQTVGLHDLTRRLRVGVRDLIVWAVAGAVAARTGGDSCLLATTGHGREDLFADLDPSRTVGWFQVLYPVLVRLTPGAGDEAGVAEVAAQLAAVPRNGIGYGHLRFAGPGSESRARLAEVRAPRLAVNYMGDFGFDEVTGTDDLFAVCQADYGPTDDGTGVWPYDLDVGGVIVGGRLRLDIGYNAEVYDRETADGFRRDVQAALLRLRNR